MLQDVSENWEFDIFELDEATGGHCLSYLSYHLFKVSWLTMMLCISYMLYKAQLTTRKPVYFVHVVLALCILQAAMTHQLPGGKAVKSGVAWLCALC